MKGMSESEFRAIIVVQIALESRGVVRKNRDMVLEYRQDDGIRGTGEWKWECTWKGDYSAYIRV
jgi:hypothetical protein